MSMRLYTHRYMDMWTNKSVERVTAAVLPWWYMMNIHNLFWKLALTQKLYQLDIGLCNSWVLEKAEEPETKLPTSTGSHLKKQESSRKTSISALLTMPKPLTVWIIINCGKFWKRREYETTWPASWETYMQVRKQQLELDMEQQTGSK